MVPVVNNLGRTLQAGRRQARIRRRLEVSRGTANACGRSGLLSQWRPASCNGASGRLVDDDFPLLAIDGALAACNLLNALAGSAAELVTGRDVGLVLPERHADHLPVLTIHHQREALVATLVLVLRQVVAL